LFNDEFVPYYDTPLVLSIVLEYSSIQALESAFQKLPTISGPDNVPLVSVNITKAHQDSMTFSNALPYIQLQIGIQDSEELLWGVFDSRAGLNVACRTYHEDIMRRNPYMVAGIHLFEDSGPARIIVGGIAVDGAAPKVTSIISYKFPYGPNGSACVPKIALTEGFSILTICGTPFQRKAELTYIPHMNTVVSILWGLISPLYFKKCEPTAPPH
jgi:hypothetical protein